MRRWTTLLAVAALLALLFAAALPVARAQIGDGAADFDDDDDDEYNAAAAAFAQAQVQARAAAAAGGSKHAQPDFVEITEWTTPRVNGDVLFVDGFDEDMKHWTVSSHPRFTGKWVIAPPSTLVGIAGDKGLRVDSPAAHHAIMHKFEEPLDTTGKTLVIQYEVKFQQKHECGGAYLKAVEYAPGMRADEFGGDSPYVIMFGPDKCGGDTNKVHFILRHQNPVSGEWEEKHLERAPLVPGDLATHVYTLVVRPDNTFSVLIDGKNVRSGSLFEDFEPPVIPPKEIDDPNDVKPADWVDEDKIPDVNAVKPDDWDEEAPAMIPDPDDVKPAGWLDNEPPMIADPSAVKPAEWSDEDDGEWEAPLIKNPACEAVGCGEWQPRKIRNPAYKGKWTPPLVDNPAYQGPWAPRRIPNPNYFADANPAALPLIGGIGVEIWTIQDQILFDNFFVGHDEEAAARFRELTWAVKHAKEMEREAMARRAEEMPESGLLDMLMTTVTSPSLDVFVERFQHTLVTHPLPVIGLLIGVFIGLPLFIIKSVTRKTVVVDLDALREEEERAQAAAEARSADAPAGHAHSAEELAAGVEACPFAAAFRSAPKPKAEEPAAAEPAAAAAPAAAAPAAAAAAPAVVEEPAVVEQVADVAEQAPSPSSEAKGKKAIKRRARAND